MLNKAKILNYIPVMVLSLCIGLGSLQAQTPYSEQFNQVSPQVERLYTKGLKYIAKQQLPDGSFQGNYGNQPGVVALAILSCLAHGEDPNSGPYATLIKRGLTFILRQQNPQNGYIGKSMYNHGFSTLALAECYGILPDERIGPALKKAIDIILTSQASNPSGGWRYRPEAKDSDTTVSGANMVALFAARNAGMAVPDEAIKRALAFYRSCQVEDGGFGYTSANGSNMPRAAIGLLVFHLAGESESPEYKNALNYLKSRDNNIAHYLYYFMYYASQAVFHSAPGWWKEWNRMNIKRLTMLQMPDGSWQGSQGAVFATSSALLSMALNYRLLPIYERQR